MRSRKEQTGCESPPLESPIIVAHVIGQVSMGVLSAGHTSSLYAVKYSQGVGRTTDHS